MKRLHQYLGLLMLLPFVAWAITGVFFFIKPGYKAAYESLPVKTYPLSIESMIAPRLPNTVDWIELRQIRTILGDHIIAKNVDGWQQLSPLSFEVINKPTSEEVSLLVKDAISINKVRYGDIKSIDDLSIITTTNIRISLNWKQLSFYQQGKDTDFINTMYDIHYLRWTGIKSVDQVLGLVGLALVLILAGLGILIMVKRQKKLTA